MYPHGLLLDKNTWDDNRIILLNRGYMEYIVVLDELTQSQLDKFQPVWSNFIEKSDLLSLAQKKAEIQKRKDPTLHQMWISNL